MAMTNWPRLSALESPIVALGRSRAELARSSARSVSGSSPSVRASIRRPSASASRTSLAPFDHVAVGQNEAVRRNHHAGTDAAGAAFGAKGFHAHHRGADFVGHGDHGIGIGVEDVGVGRGRGPRPADVRDIGRRSKIEHRRLKGMC